MTAVPEAPPRSSDQDVNLDLGFGSVVARESRKRLLNRDGTFNVKREGLSFFESLSAYHFFLTISWSQFLFMVCGAYLVTNAVFALAYVACGPNALTGFAAASIVERFCWAFFFSVDTLATIGYGNIVPATLVANVLVTVESLVGLLAFAFIGGIVFARFARPMAKIVFSRNAIIAPYRGGTAFMFRIMNQKSNELVELEAKVMLSKRKHDGAQTGDRNFTLLKLERESVVFFPLSWTIVHPIDESSPLFGKTHDELREVDAEFLVILNGFDETFSQTVHTRSSYKADEIVWGAKFRSNFNPPRADGTISVNIARLHEIDHVSLDA